MRPLAWAVIITTLAARATGHLHDETPAAARRLALFRNAKKATKSQRENRQYKTVLDAPPKEPAYGLAPIFRNPDPKAQWPRKRNWNTSRPASWTVANTERLCTGSRQSNDVIVYLGQKTHSSYGATAGRGTRSGPTRTSTSARTGTGTPRRASGRIGRRRT